MAALSAKSIRCRKDPQTLPLRLPAWPNIWPRESRISNNNSPSPSSVAVA